MFLRNKSTAVDTSYDHAALEPLFDAQASVEHLERRLMLAGNVRVLINSAGDVTIKGDGKSNYVEVFREVSDQNGDNDTNDIVIRGIADTNGQDTGIKDGRDILPQFVINASDGTFAEGLNLSLGGGNDLITLRDITINGEFKFSPGGGSDSLGFFNSTAKRNSTFKTSGGSDFMNLVDATFEGDLYAKTGSGVDYFGLSNFALADGKTATFITGGSPDIIYIEDSTVAGDIVVEMAGLIDTIYVADGTTFTGNVTVDTGNGFDLLILENDVDVSQATLNIDGGRGAFGYENQLFLYVDSPFLAAPPAGIVGFESDVYTISGNSYTGDYDMSHTLSIWIMDLYYSSQPVVDIDVIDTVLAANMAHGFDYADLPANDGPEPDPAYLADQIELLLNSPDFYLYQKIFVKNVFSNEIKNFDWS